MTRTATIVRKRQQIDDFGTFGTLTLDDGWTCCTGELPWRDNAPELSCIPEGDYLATVIESAKFNTRVLLLQGVPERSAIEGHAANWMGDVTKGLRCELLGCIAFGMANEILGGQLGLVESLAALHELVARLDGEPLLLTIRWENAPAAKKPVGA